MSQNIYDDQGFFEGYSRLSRFDQPWGQAYEHPYFAALLRPIPGGHVLDLGCGAGQLSYHLAEAGAAEVIGVDVSEKMLALATSKRSHPNVSYRLLPMEDLAFPPDRFDLVVSSLALHYVEDYAGLIGRIAGWLRPGGVLVYSTEHPIYTAGYPHNGWETDERGRKLRWTLDDYGVAGLREARWFVEGVRKYHRPFSALVNGLLDAGLAVERVVEPFPTEDAARLQPLLAEELRRPTFLLVRARKP